jgi:pimeloyl-ACP methyl ester carboxylesterase
MTKLTSVLPQAEQRTLAGADHAPMTSQPAAYVAAIREFMLRVPAALPQTG